MANEGEVYLFTGPEAGEKNEAIDNIRAAAMKKNGSLDEYKYYASETRMQDVIAQLENESLFTPALFVVFKNAEQVKLKADLDALVSWIKNGSKNSPNTLVLVSDENSVDKKIDSAVPSSHKKMFWEMFDNRKEAWVQSYFRKNGFSVTSDAVERILDMVENNTETLKSECSRFFYCFDQGYTVTEADVDKILAHNREESAFTLFESMMDTSKSPKERLQTSLEILQKIRLSKDSSGVMIIAGLSYCFRQLRSWHKIHADGAKPTDVQLKSNGFSGKKNQEKYAAASRVWSTGSTGAIISLLAKTDMCIRENGSAMEDVNLFKLVYSIVVKNGRSFSEYVS